MKLSERTFHRLFSASMYKNLKLPLGEMTMTKDFATCTRGDLYPLLSKSEDCAERVEGGRYFVDRGRAERVLGQFFPYATYEVSFCTDGGSVGFCFRPDGICASVVCDGGSVTLDCGSRRETFRTDKPVSTLIVSCRPGAFDIYGKQDSSTAFLHTFPCEDFSQSHRQSFFEKGVVSLLVSGQAQLQAASFYIDSGVSLADIRPICYHNGEIMTENGKVYLTASVRMQEEFFQGIFSWVPGTAQFALTGAVFFDSGDGFWCADVASSLRYHRETGKWYLWVCSFHHGHILGHAALDGDIRFGVNVADITLMEPAGADAVYSDFVGFAEDEDPDFIFDAAQNCWYMAVCRMDRQTGGYRYAFFRSEDPFTGYTYVGCGEKGEETGGSFVFIEGRLHFICGNSFSARSDYRIYDADGMHSARFDYPDGGFRGWGTVMPIKTGNRTQYYWLTFDRHNGSDYNWSYGNIYCFKAI